MTRSRAAVVAGVLALLPHCSSAGLLYVGAQDYPSAEEGGSLGGTAGETATMGGTGGGTTGWTGGGTQGPKAPRCARPGTLENRTITVGTESRHYLLSVPPGLDVNQPVPIVLAFHSRGETAADARGYLGLEAALPNWGLFIYPEGVSRDWGDGSKDAGWQLGPATNFYGGDADIAFIRALLGTLKSELCVEPQLVAAVGYGWGADISSVLGCYLGDLLTAIVTAYTNTPFFLPKSAESDPPCVGRVATFAWNRDNDPAYPLSYGVEHRDFWLASNGCGGPSPVLESPSLPATDTCSVYTCTGPAVRDCTYASESAKRVPSYFATMAMEFLHP